MFVELMLLFAIICTFIYFILPLEHINIEKRTVNLMNRLHGPKGVPLLGMGIRTLTLQEKVYFPFLKNIMDQYPRLTGVWIAGMPFVLMQEPEDIEVLLSSSTHTIKGIEYKPITPWLKEGLLNSSGEKWRRRRKMLTPAFHFSILQDNLPCISKHAKHLLKNMINNDAKPFVAEDLITLCALDVICETAMGYSVNAQDDHCREYLQAVKRIQSMVVRRVMSFYLRKDWLFNLMPFSKGFYKDIETVHNFTEKVIKEKRANYIAAKNKKSQESNLIDANLDRTEFECLPKTRKAFIDSIVELMDSSLTTDQDIREEIETFMFAGHDTISTAATFALYELGLNPDVQEKVFAELKDIFGESKRDPTRNDLNEMNYLGNVIKESMRKYPSVPYISRKLIQDLTLKDGTVLPKGANVVMLPYFLHRHPKYFPNPEIFDPSRFSLDNYKKRHPYCYLPYSAGPRNCIGQKFASIELKIIISTIIRYAIVETVTKPEDFTMLPLLILRPSSPIKLKVTPRNQVINC